MMGEIFSVPVGHILEVRMHHFARSQMPCVPDDAYGQVFPHNLDEAAPADMYQAALLAREAKAFDAFRRASGRSVNEVLSGAKPFPMFPPRAADDDESVLEAQRARSIGPKLASAREFCERFIKAVAVPAGDRDRIALVSLHRLAVTRGLKACPSLVMFSRAMQQDFTCMGGRSGTSTMLVGWKLKPEVLASGSVIKGGAKN